MGLDITPKEAGKRVLATAVQAAGGASVALLGLIMIGPVTMGAVVGILVGSFAVPVLTAVQRYSQAWLAQREGQPE